MSHIKYTVGLIFGLLCFHNSAIAQEGCTDSQALNYDANATENDGSCQYPFTIRSPQVIANLPDNLEECSGIIWASDILFTIVDNNPTKLFRLDPSSGAVLQEHQMLGASNMDWEDLAKSESGIYIGDIGNNDGDRQDLKIYRANIASILSPGSSTVTQEYSYSDQFDFTHPTNQHNFDCEALLWVNDSLHLFSKNWLTLDTKHYSLAMDSDQAEVQQSFFVSGLVTAADIDENGRVALLVRADQGVSVWLLWDYKGQDFFSGNRRRLFLGVKEEIGQAEGLAFDKDGKLWMATEGNDDQPQRLFNIEVQDLLTNTAAPINYSFQVYPNPTADEIIVEGTELFNKHWQLVNGFGQQVESGQFAHPHSETISLAELQLPSGVYYLNIEHAQPQRVIYLGQ